MESIIGWELEFLFHAFLAGAWLGFCYDCLRVFRICIPHRKWLVSFQDLAFWLWCTFRIFQMQYYENNGITRWFSIAGLLAGLFVYEKLLGEFYVKYTGRAGRKIFQWIKQRLTSLWKLFKITLCKHKKQGCCYGKRRIRIRKKRQNKVAMVLVATVVLMLVVVVFYSSIQLKEKLAVYKEKEQLLTEQLEKEKARTEEIEEFEKYTKTKKYIEEAAKEKLGLVYEDEIIFQTEE